MKNNKNSWIFGIVIFSILFLGGSILFQIFDIKDLPSQFYGALIGTVITAIITVLLLKGQTANEEKKEQNIRIFEKKSEIFSDFIDHLWGIWKKKNISMAEVVELIGRVSRDVIPYSSPNTTKEILGYLNTIADSINKEDLPKKIDENVFNIINALSKEIGLGGELNADVRKELNLLENKVMPFFNKQQIFNKISERLSEKSSKNLHSFTEEKNILWFKVGQETGVWLRIGKWGKAENIYVAFWSDYENTQYYPYRYSSRGFDKDFFADIYAELESLTKEEFNAMLQGEKISSEKIENLVNEVMEIYEKPNSQGKTIQEIINEVKK